MIKYTIPDSLFPIKLRNILKTELKLSTRLINHLKNSSGITLSGQPIRTIDLVRPGDMLVISWEEACDSPVEPQNIPLHILFEDDWFLAINKSSGMPVHPSHNHHSDTLANAVQFLFKDRGLTMKIRPINRLDRDTSGVILFAKHSHAQDQIIRLMKCTEVYKEYLGIVEGCFPQRSGTIDLPIARKPGSIIERMIDPSGDKSITHYSTIQTDGELSLVQFVLETGRTHQIRVHCSANEHPIIGDWLYSTKPTTLIGRQALHSHKLRFSHPRNGELLEIDAPLPDDMQTVLKSFHT